MKKLCGPTGSCSHGYAKKYNCGCKFTDSDSFVARCEQGDGMELHCGIQISLEGVTRVHSTGTDRLHFAFAPKQSRESENCTSRLYREKSPNKCRNIVHARRILDVVPDEHSETSSRLSCGESICFHPNFKGALGQLHEHCSVD